MIRVEESHDALLYSLFIDYSRYKRVNSVQQTLWHFCMEYCAKSSGKEEHYIKER